MRSLHAPFVHSASCDFTSSKLQEDAEVLEVPPVLLGFCALQKLVQSPMNCLIAGVQVSSLLQ